MIYIVEDDDDIRDLMVYSFRNSRLDAEGFSRPSDFWKAMASELPDIILLDIMLPEEDGISILRKLRSKEKTRSIPVMMVTAKGSEYDKVQGLDLGADDYLAKPFGIMELIARVKALMRRTGTKSGDSPEEEVLRHGSIELRPAGRYVSVGGEDVKLSAREFDLLEYFMRRPGVVLSRDLILTRVWGYSCSIESRTVDVHVKSLRKKLGDAGAEIETVRGIGYRLNQESDA